jgi:hypothetical protein
VIQNERFTVQATLELWMLFNKNQEVWEDQVTTLLSQVFSLFRRGYQELQYGIRKKISNTLGHGVLSVGKHILFLDSIDPEGEGCRL